MGLWQHSLQTHQVDRTNSKMKSKMNGYSLVPKESNVTLVPHTTLIRPNTLSLKGAITLFWVNTKRKTVMTLIRIVLLSN